MMSEWCFNYDSGRYEDIDEDGYSRTQGKYVNNWDDGDYRRQEDEERRREEEEEEERRREEEEEERRREEEEDRW